MIAALACILCLAASPSTRPTTGPVAAPDVEASLSYKLNTAVERAEYFLLQRQDKSGAWLGSAGMSERATGRTALVGLALLAAGQSSQSPEILKAVEFLKKQKQERVYSVALRAAFYSQLPEALRRSELRADARWLIAAAGKRGPLAGMYTYEPVGGRYQWRGDYSNSQYGVLGVWYAAEAGIEVPHSYWKSIESAWLKGQNEDGGWGYTPDDGRSYSSMSAAGAASLFITNDYLHAQKERDLRTRVTNKPLDAAMSWMGKYFSVDHNLGRDAPLREEEPEDALGRFFAQRPGTWIYYMLFGYERVGEASGYTRFGNRRWFDEGAQFLIRQQQDDGSWVGDLDPEVDTAYALLFLARGRAPVALQKLQYEGRWNNRSRDAARLVHWLSRQTERHTNWQIIGADATPAELREAPILYISGNEPFVPNSGQMKRIKQYVEQGGLILAVNEGNGAKFSNSIEKLARTAFPDYPMRDLPADHLVFNENFSVGPLNDAPGNGSTTGPATSGASGPLVRGVSNGVRELILLIPTGDFSWKWQAGAGTDIPAKAPAFALAGNIWLYVTDKNNPRFKGDDWWIEPLPRIADRWKLDVARLVVGGNCNPEPAGWTRIANLLRNQLQIRIKTYNVEPGIQAFTPVGYALAHLTSTGAIELTTPQQDALKNYLDEGGLLLFDAAGGSVAASVSMEALIARLYPDAKIARLPDDHDIYTAKFDGGRSAIKSVTYRRFTSTREPNSTRPRLRGVTEKGKLIAILSAEDLSAGIVGYPTDGIAGYSPASATEIVRNILLWRVDQLASPAPR